MINVVKWVWWAGAAFALLALLPAGAWPTPDGERSTRSGHERTQQIQLVVGEVEPAARP
ncbi:hypothetical protein [Umezawaea sp. Da 62-37]|uniref:hypothetical protein n=1 Tax=Umezawaea sp. Da 62-37 TaxID=3075927 RepID=UPI0028F7248C|nr:hypothetical protein [Umezawaea sp. Da 62-37]WNV87709.1 hypothetical protein RM788_05305 [Umezawaea sp. Da 62-37]